MNQKAYSSVTAIIFLLISILHVLRIVFGWSAVIGGWSVPGWVSWVALVVAGFLAYQGLRLAR